MGLLHIYDDDDLRMRWSIKRWDAEKAIPVRGGALKMVDHLDAIVASKRRYDRILFETHGAPGWIWMGDDAIDALWLRSIADRGYAGICTPGARLYFNGCNVAEGEEGWDFLRAGAELFLSGRGGVCFGHTSIGFADPFGHVVHPWGDTRHVVMMAGGDAV